jgi:hypothetical protein
LVGRLVWVSISQVSIGQEMAYWLYNSFTEGVSYLMAPVEAVFSVFSLNSKIAAAKVSNKLHSLHLFFNYVVRLLLIGSPSLLHHQERLARGELPYDPDVAEEIIREWGHEDSSGSSSDEGRHPSGWQWDAGAADDAIGEDDDEMGWVRDTDRDHRPAPFPRSPLAPMHSANPHMVCQVLWAVD